MIRRYTKAVRWAVSRMIPRMEVKGADVPERTLLEPRLHLHGHVPDLRTFAAGKSTELAGAAGFWRLLILMDRVGC
jgi:hypothetical protein